MARPTHNAYLDTDGLQADVMRFMAIIAFCLIAILALVKNTDPPKAGAGIAMNPPVAETIAILPHPEIVSYAATIRQQNSMDIKTPEKIEISQRAPPADTPFDVQQDRSLTLRFSSDAAFLSLIAGNEIQLYGLGDGGFTGMAANFTTTRVQPSGELYELLPGSVPRGLVSIFERESEQMAYLVALSNNTRRELNNLMQRMNKGNSKPHKDKQQANGTLVIHRDGHVSHEI